MIEAVENQSPDIIIVDGLSNRDLVRVRVRVGVRVRVRPLHSDPNQVDELSNRDECNAARTITGRGVAIVATVQPSPSP